MLALVTATSATALDPDLEPLVLAFEAIGVAAHVVSWDDPMVDWSRFDNAIIRSTWDYVDRLDDFKAWLVEAAARTRLVNPLEAIRWSLDKHYLAELAASGVPVVPTLFVEVGESVPDLDSQQHSWVVKPVVGASSSDVRRCRVDVVNDAVSVIHRTGTAAIVQPYLDLIDSQSETSLIFLGDGAQLEYSHAVCKDAVLSDANTNTNTDDDVDRHSADLVGVRIASSAELALAAQVLAADAVHQRGPLAYARVDVVPTHDGPVLMELELVEPSLYLVPNTAGSEAVLVERAAIQWKAYSERMALREAASGKNGSGQ